jgi:hypothetical protein
MPLLRRSQPLSTLSANHARRPLNVTIRRAFPDDADALARLAALDSSPPIAAEALVAEVADELWAAISLTDGRRIADPFRPTAELVGLLEFRLAQLNHAPPAKPRALQRLIPLFDWH